MIPAATMTVEVAIEVVTLLFKITTEWDNCGAEDAKVRQITDRLDTLRDPIMTWAKAQSQTRKNDGLIRDVLQDLTDIKAWLDSYRASGEYWGGGVLARCVKMTKNVVQNKVGITTSFQHLRDIVETLEEKLRTMSIVVQLGLVEVIDDVK